jgi:nicotinamidase-related amidase
MAMTMLQMSGVAPAPATMKDGVLLEKARAAGAPVVHVRHASKGKAFNPESTGYEIVKPLTPRAGEVIVDKGLPNAFAGTELAKHLGATGRKNLIVGGFMTHMCVSATVRSATDHGFMSTVAADTVATRDLPDATGSGTIDAASLNRITLAALSDRFAWIVPKAAAIG